MMKDAYGRCGGNMTTDGETERCTAPVHIALRKQYGEWTGVAAGKCEDGHAIDKQQQDDMVSDACFDAEEADKEPRNLDPDPRDLTPVFKKCYGCGYLGLIRTVDACPKCGGYERGCPDDCNHPRCGGLAF